LESTAYASVGTDGTMAEVMSKLAKQANYSGKVRSLLLHHRDVLEHSVEVLGLNERRPELAEQTSQWGHYLDEGLTSGELTVAVGDDLVSDTDHTGFEKTRPSPTSVRWNGTQWVTDTSAYKELLYFSRYLQTVLGLDAGTRDALEREDSLVDSASLISR
jgi:hypothetical protein